MDSSRRVCGCVHTWKALRLVRGLWQTFCNFSSLLLLLFFFLLYLKKYRLTKVTGPDKGLPGSKWQRPVFTRPGSRRGQNDALVVRVYAESISPSWHLTSARSPFCLSRGAVGTRSSETPGALDPIPAPTPRLLPEPFGGLLDGAVSSPVSFCLPGPLGTSSLALWGFEEKIFESGSSLPLCASKRTGGRRKLNDGCVWMFLGG